MCRKACTRITPHGRSDHVVGATAQNIVDRRSHHCYPGYGSLRKAHIPRPSTFESPRGPTSLRRSLDHRRIPRRPGPRGAVDALCGHRSYVRGEREQLRPAPAWDMVRVGAGEARVAAAALILDRAASPDETQPRNRRICPGQARHFPIAQSSPRVNNPPYFYATAVVPSRVTFQDTAT
jgi:hypothetical protein